jgi:hypothetical protein
MVTCPAFEAVRQKLGKWEGQMTQSLNGAETTLTLRSHQNKTKPQ